MNKIVLSTALAVNKLRQHDVHDNPWPEIEHGLAIKFFEWCLEFIVKPHASLGRGGAVCPFVAPAIKENSLLFTVARGTQSGKEEIKEALFLAQNLFVDIQKQDPAPKSRALKSLVVIFPDLLNITFEGEHPLKESRIAVRDAFIKSGLTCGEFYPENQDKSIHSDDLYVAQSPIPAVVIRELAAHDELFLQSNPSQLQLFRNFFKG